MTYKLGDRVVLVADLNTPNAIYKAGTICNIAIEPSNEKNEMIILTAGYDDTNTPIMFGAAESFLRKAKQDDIINIDFKKVVNKNFWINESYKVSNNTSFDGVTAGSIGVIVDIKLTLNEFDDNLIFKFGNVQGYEFKRSFVEMHFDKYDQEVEDMMGDEIVIKGTKRNYHLPGARMILNQTVNNVNEGSMVIIQRYHKEKDVYEVESLLQETLYVTKEQLSPIVDGESFMQYQENEDYLIPLYFRTGNLLIADENIENHALLNKNIKPGDVIEILNVSGININAFEDVYLISVNNQFDKPMNITYSDLKKFFTWYSSPHQEAEEEEVKEEIPSIVEQLLSDEKELDLSVFNTDAKVKVKVPDEPIMKEFKDEFEKIGDTEEYNSVPILIHDLSILDFRFKIDHKLNAFKIDDSESSYQFDQIDSLIIALKELKKLNRENSKE